MVLWLEDISTSTVVPLPTEVGEFVGAGLVCEGVRV